VTVDLNGKIQYQIISENGSKRGSRTVPVAISEVRVAEMDGPGQYKTSRFSSAPLLSITTLTGCRFRFAAEPCFFQGSKFDVVNRNGAVYETNQMDSKFENRMALCTRPTRWVVNSILRIGCSGVLNTLELDGIFYLHSQIRLFSKLSTIESSNMSKIVGNGCIELLGSINTLLEASTVKFPNLVRSNRDQGHANTT
jgi:hypothetical protein